jgi:hypothetical protein
MEHFLGVANELGRPARFVDLAGFVDGDWELHLPPHGPSWVAGDDGERQLLDESASYFCRLIDLAPVSPAQAVEWRTLFSALSAWLELYPGKVVNRPGSTSDNACKPLHEAVLAELGFEVAPSVTSSSRETLRSFVGSGEAVAKPVCGQRADCRVVRADDFDDYDERSGPVHLQRLVPGEDVRAHVVGEDVLALRVRSEADDYRLDHDAEFEPCRLPPDLCRDLVDATRGFGLSFAGWDLRESDGRYWVFEANPMPGYHYYDVHLSGAISRSLIADLVNSA